MAAGRAIWTGTMSVALLSVPVKLYTATRSSDVTFNQIERSTGARIRYKRISEATGAEVRSAEIVKGYDLGGERYVAIEPDELDRVIAGAGVRYVPPPEPSPPGRTDGPGNEPLARPYGPNGDDNRPADEADETDEADDANEREDEAPTLVLERRVPVPKVIDIVEFVDAAHVDPIYLDKHYYLAPDRGGGRPFELLVDSMEADSKAAVARMVMRTKEHLVAIRAVSGELRLSTLRFADEVLDPPTYQRSAVAPEVTDRERAVAAELLDALGGNFTPASYTNDRRDQVLAMIESRRVVRSDDATAGVAAQPSELLAALEASLAAAMATRATAAPSSGTR